MDIRLTSDQPPVEDFIRMRAECGWGEISVTTAQAMLRRGDFCVTCWSGEQLVGLGRAFGDGLYYLIEDIIVDPSCRGQGLGAKVVQELVDQIKAEAPVGGFIGLMSDVGKEGFYEKLGFVRRPNEKRGAGLSMVVGD